jgi:hypothetical protein
MIGRLAVFALVALGVAAPSQAQSYGVAPLPGTALAKIRGGFDLPNGLIINLGVTTDTKVDGESVLRTIFNIDQGAPILKVLANQAEGLSELDLAANDAAVTTADGSVRLQSGASGARVQLVNDSIDVSHLIGQAYGSVVANSGSDRSIEVQTTIDIGVSGIRPDAIGGSLARAGDLALDATSRLSR